MSQQPGEYTSDQEPLVNIGAVSRLTGIPDTTLRVWERRYDFPKPARTTGGHRLYSRHEVRRLQWVKRQMDEGMQISRAIHALRQAERKEEHVRTSPVVPSLAGSQESDPALLMFRQRLVTSLLQRDIDEADHILGETLALVPIETLVMDIISPALHAIGEAWAEGRIDVATEHFATNHLRHHLLLWMRTGPPAYQVDPLVLACAPGELHEGGLLVIAVLLRRLRWPFVFLGQTTPLTGLENFLEGVNASVLVFVAMTEESAGALSYWPLWLPQTERTGRPIVTYGGRVFVQQPELVARVPGRYLGDTMHEGVQALDQILHELNPSVR